MTAFVELPLVSEQAHRTVWLNPAQVGSVEAGMPSKPDSCWVTMVWGCRHQIAVSMDEAVECLDPTVLLSVGGHTPGLDLRYEVRENLNR